MFNNNNETDTYEFSFILWHHKLDDESLEDLQIEIQYKPKTTYDFSDDVNCYLTLEAFSDIQSYDTDYKGGLVYKTVINIEISYYKDYYGGVDADVVANVCSHEIVSTNVDKWYKDNCC